MEDSRNIIKAIDALTLKAGGDPVDSKNITEAIDNLKAVFDQQAIGIDDTLTQEGLAADAKAVGDAIGTISTSSYYEPSIYDSRVENAKQENADASRVYAYGKVRVASFFVKVLKQMSSDLATIFILDSSDKPAKNVYSVAHNLTSDKIYRVQVSSTGNINIVGASALEVDDRLIGQIVWITK